jgi:hypothetical protein
MYKNKYLKYKNKYIELKKMIGSSAFKSNFDIIINNRLNSLTPSHTLLVKNKNKLIINLTNLYNFLINNEIPIIKIHPIANKNNDFLINFSDNKTVEEYLNKIGIILEAYDDNTTYEIPVVEENNMTVNNQIKPWEQKSNRLYIALVISPTSQIGIDLTELINNSTDSSQQITFKNYPNHIKNNRRIKTPHVSLLTLWTPDHSDIDKLLNKSDFQNLLATNITDNFKSCFNYATNITSACSGKDDYINLNNGMQLVT